MALLRRIVLVLLCVALPGYGLAAVAPFAGDCPMHQQGAGTMDMDGDTVPCCDHCDHMDKPGERCKSGQDCRTFSQVQLTHIVVPSAPIPTVAITTRLTQVSLASYPLAVWRPPCQL